MPCSTRSSSALNGSDHGTNSATGEEAAVTPASEASFKSQLQRFQYTSDVPPSPSRSATSHASSMHTRRKRQLDEEAPVEASRVTPSPRAAKKKKPSSRYAPPSKYAHLPPLQDILAPNLICIFVGTNPGIRTATAGHAYAHPSNLFWKLLHASGCTETRLRPEQDATLPRRYAMGNTNIVERASRDAGELSKKEMAAGTPGLEAKVREYRPEAVCIVGKGIWEAVWRWRYGREMKKEEFKWGWQDEGERMGWSAARDGGEDAWPGAKVFVTSSTSGLSASLKPAEKLAIWEPFGAWVKARRKERFGTEGRLEDGHEAA